MKLLILFASFSFAGCIKLNLDPITVDVDHQKLLIRHTDESKPKADVDLPSNLWMINKYTCFSPDDMAQVERALNQ